LGRPEGEIRKREGREDKINSKHLSPIRAEGREQKEDKWGRERRNKNKEKEDIQETKRGGGRREGRGYIASG
jgi:hypothetical protein